MSADLVIAGNFREAAEFRAQESLSGRDIVRSRESLTGRRPARIHLLPEFFKRRDVPAWRSQLRSLLRSSPKTQILVWDYGNSGFAHVSDVRVDNLAQFIVRDAGSTKPEPLPRVEKVDPVPDTEVPGQIPIEEAITATETDNAEGQSASSHTESAPETEQESTDIPPAKPAAKPRKPKAAKPKPEKDELLADLEAKGVIESEGFELSDDPKVQAKQILESAAHHADDDDPFGDF